ncbi:MAG: ribonuclease H-like domain-containing protein [Bacillus sp. (in: Bacteria)]|nr:ribonuclease H-like domain-containing protein [Bacillus sp. (in: firmicutes)]
MNLKSKLNRMKNHLQLEGQEERKTVKKEVQPADELTRKWRDLGFKAFVYEEQTAYEKRYTIPFQKLGGSHLQEELEQVDSLWKKASLEHPLSSKKVPLNRMLFFDTETTGLSTGAGNSIFLIGYSRISQEGVEVTQRILRDPSSEAAFLYGFLEDFKDDDFLVSYNGKAFDWPQVKSRHTFVRNQVPRLPAFGHIDLLHAARRLWKHELPSCRLSIVEKEKLGIHRVGDTPGSMAPLLYFDYIHEQEPNHLKGIIEHNDQDVRSLIHLYITISKRLLLGKEHTMSVMEHVQIGNWFEQFKWQDHAKEHYLKALEKEQLGREEAYFKLAMLEKKQGNSILAKELLIKAVAVAPKAEAFEELSKIAEHQDKQVDLAYDYCRKAMDSRVTTSKRKALEKRLERLEKKLG